MTIVKEKNIELLLIAIPGATPSQMRRIVNLCEQTTISYRTLPSLSDITSGKRAITNIRKVTVEDLLCRDSVQFDHKKIVNFIKDKIILITGAGGSIGSQLCKKLAEVSPKSLILIELNEYNLFKIQSDLQNSFPHLTLHCYLVSVTDFEMINIILILFFMLRHINTYRY
jgi:FlaA1/EpsC-like NDP-sugar epimerase